MTSLGFPRKQDVESPDGQWTRVEVICQGDRITNIVNGTTVIRGHSLEPARKGRSFSSPRVAEIFFRKVTLTLALDPAITTRRRLRSGAHDHTSASALRH